MEVQDRLAIVTGGGRGIGEGLAVRLAEAGAEVVVVDRDAAAAHEVATRIGGRPLTCDVTDEPAVQRMIADATADRPCDLFFSNAGVTSKGGLDVADAGWQQNWDVNVMSHVYASRAVVPGMIARGGGAFVITSSAAGLLTEIGSAPYSVSKHAALGFAEWLSVRYRREGLQVCCLCPAGVATGFLNLSDPVHQFLHMNAITPLELADLTLAALREGRFLVTCHKEVLDFFAFKGQDYDRWLHNFSRLQQKIQRMEGRMTRDAASDAGPCDAD